jgi:hypothetical protein
VGVSAGKRAAGRLKLAAGLHQRCRVAGSPLPMPVASFSVPAARVPV